MSYARLLYRFEHGDRPSDAGQVIDLENKDSYEAINGWVSFGGLKNAVVSRHRGVELSGFIVEKTYDDLNHAWMLASQYDLVALVRRESGLIEIMVYVPMAELSMTDLFGEVGMRVRFCSTDGYDL